MRIREYVKENYLFFDGAMGTYLQQKYGNTQNYCEVYNITNPEWVVKAHESYIMAGAKAIKTNTFAANSYNFSEENELADIIRSGCQLARRAVENTEKQETFIFADIGPINVSEEEDLFLAYQKVINLFLDCGIKCFLFETFGTPECLEQVAAYIKQKEEEAYVITSFGISPEGFTRDGYFGRSIFHQLQDVEEIDAIGFNCVSGPRHLCDFIKKLPIKECNKEVVVMPNAGYPTRKGRRNVFEENDAYFAEVMSEIAKEGVAILGGCCGTNPKFIQSMVSGLADKTMECNVSKKTKENEQKLFTAETVLSGMDNPHNQFAAKLKEGKKVLVIELDPPVNTEIDFFLEGASLYKKAGVDAIDIADCPIARARIDSSLLACKVKREIGLDVIPHMTCRDRNINATKALLLGLNVEGVNTVLTVTGDPVPVAEREEVKVLFSYNSAVLAKHIETFNEATFTHNPFLTCGALNVNARNFDSQIAHAKKKIESGVSVLFTQPVLTEQALQNLIRAKKELPVKILGGIIPVVSYRNACFMNQEIAGIEVDESIVERYKDKTREEGEELAVEITTEMAKKISPYVDGFYLITPFKRVQLMLRIIENIRDLL